MSAAPGGACVYGPIGHMGYFRPRAQALWQAALGWFETLPARPAAALASA